MATQAIPPPPHPPVATLGPGPASFQKKPGFVEKVAHLRKKGDLRQTRRSRVWGGPWRIFPTSADFLIILKLMIFSRNFFNKKAALIWCLGDPSIKQHLLLRGEL